MAKIDEKTAFELITHYYDNEHSKVSTLNTFLGLLEDVIDDEKNLARANLTEKELASEATYALLQTFHEAKEKGSAKDWNEAFLGHLRSGLRRFKLRKRTYIDIGEMAIEDPSPNPEELYITKELVHLVRLFIHNNYDLVAADWFMRRYAEGERAEEIAELYSVSARAVNKRLKQMMPRIRRYMEKIDGEG